jgi:transcription elongation factor GreA-like protein
MLLNDQWVIEKVREEIFKNPRIQWKQKHTLQEYLGPSKISTKGKA